MTFGELKVGQQFYFESYYGGQLCVKVSDQCVFKDSGSYRPANRTQPDFDRLSQNDSLVRAA